MARADELTIDELAQQTGVSSRNIRYYQTRGLLPPPRVKGRAGVYGETHVERLQLLNELKNEGLNLQAIGFLLGGSGAVDTDEVRGLKRAILDGWVTSEPYETSIKELTKGLKVTEEDALRMLDRSIELGLVELSETDGNVRVLLPEILSAGRALLAMGVGFERSLDVLAIMRENVVGIARSYVELFDEMVLGPWDARGRPSDEWKNIREAVEEIRPVAGEALLAVFQQVISQAIADSIANAAPE